MIDSPKLRTAVRLVIPLALLIFSSCAFPFAARPLPPQPAPFTPTEPNLPTGAAPQTTATSGQPEITTAEPLIEPTSPPTEPPPAPEEPSPTAIPPVGPALAFLDKGDIWIVDTPGSQPYPLTVAGDILGFTWSPNGERLTAFNGHTLCFYYRDGSLRTACLDLGLNDEQAKIERRLTLSPDQRYVVLWNPINPADEGALGWMIVALDSTNLMYRIEDPLDWGAVLTEDNERGGFTGQPTFLPDGRLVGTLSHRSACGSGCCHYQLFQFDFETRAFIPFANKPEDGFSEGISLQLSQDGRALLNFGTFFEDCESYVTFVDSFDLQTEQRQIYDLPGEALAEMAFNPASGQAALARTSGCSQPDTETWAAQCGLSQDYEILPMQLWTPGSAERTDLPSGLAPTWSADGEWLAFRSCLVQDAANGWAVSGEVPAQIFLLNLADNSITEISSGMSPQWQP